MPQLPLRADHIPHPSLQLGNVGKAAVGLAFPDWLAIGFDAEYTAGAWLQGHFTQFVAGGGQQFLRVPGAAQQPVARGPPA